MQLLHHARVSSFEFPGEAGRVAQAMRLRL